MTQEEMIKLLYDGEDAFGEEGEFEMEEGECEQDEDCEKDCCGDEDDDDEK